jgi:prophage regulatory protein
MQKILDHNQILDLTGASKVTIWRWERDGKFPKRVNLSENKVGWFEDDVAGWIESRPRGICQRDFGKEALT